MVLLGEADFLAALGRLYEESKEKNAGSVWLTFKRTYPEAGGSRGVKRRRKLQGFETQQQATPCCLIRATDGKHKYSVQVSAERVAAFSQQLSRLIRQKADKVGPATSSKKKKQKEAQQQQETQQQQQQQQQETQQQQQEAQQEQQKPQQQQQQQQGKKGSKEGSSSLKREA